MLPSALGENLGVELEQCVSFREPAHHACLGRIVTEDPIPIRASETLQTAKINQGDNNEIMRGQDEVPAALERRAAPSRWSVSAEPFWLSVMTGS